MKKFFIILFLLGTLPVLAQTEQNWGWFFSEATPTCIQFSLVNDYGDHPKPQHVPALLPVLGYDGNTFVLATPYELEDVTIVIRDENGTVLYYDTVSSITDYYMFQLTDDVIADMFSIELYYGDRHLYGEF